MRGERPWKWQSRQAARVIQRPQAQECVCRRQIVAACMPAWQSPFPLHSVVFRIVLAESSDSSPPERWQVGEPEPIEKQSSFVIVLAPLVDNQSLSSPEAQPQHEGICCSFRAPHATSSQGRKTFELAFATSLLLCKSQLHFLAFGRDLLARRGVCLSKHGLTYQNHILACGRQCKTAATEAVLSSTESTAPI